MAVLLLTHPQPAEPFARAFAQSAPQETIFTELAVAQTRPAEVEAVLLWRLSPGMLAPFQNLRMICASAGGVDKILSCTDRPAGVPVTRTVDAAQNQQIAQYVVMNVLRHVRQLNLFQAQAERREWTRHLPPAPEDIHVGLLGLGESGRAVATALLALGINVMGWSRSGREMSGVECFCGAQGLLDMLPKTQVLVCLLPLTPQTQGIVDRRVLARLPRGAYLINVARGGLLDETALLEAVRTGHLDGAALDVQSREPLPADDPLWNDPKILITPHIASLPSADAVVMQVVENLQRIRSGQRPLRQIDDIRGY